MKNLGKIGLWLLGAAVIYVGGRWIIKRSKATYAELERREKENREILRKTGRTEEEVEGEDLDSSEDSEKIDYDINLSKRLFHDCRFLSSLPIDVVDSVEILKEYDQHVVHVNQSFDRRSKRNVLNFLFEIPMSALSRDDRDRKYSDGNTNFMDFKRAICGRWDHEKGAIVEEGFQKTMESIVKNPEHLGLTIVNGNYTYCDGWVEPYAFISYEEKEDEEWISKTNLIKLEKDIIENNPFNPEHFMATDFIYDLNQVYSQQGEERNNLKIDSNNDAFRNIEVIDAFIAIRVSFYVQDKFHMDGINAKSGLKILEEIYDKLEIEGRRSNGRSGAFVYDKFLFYKEDRNDDISVYYEDNGVIKDMALYD